ncbi:hypothetical protein ACJX0J_039636, partial [Zea mays]
VFFKKIKKNSIVDKLTYWQILGMTSTEMIQHLFLSALMPNSCGINNVVFEKNCPIPFFRWLPETKFLLSKKCNIRLNFYVWPAHLNRFIKGRRLERWTITENVWTLKHYTTILLSALQIRARR